ncbi:RABEP1 [Cordylochernes scorpioides]|uniref:RABEP1 n=1 Tax=Cordylochernes scorpioides TaxID=51811 RepID=A0ABY6K9A4_9ARAC|nr:RABEP1 [Cordylochernes scorpioides]
MSGKPVCVPEVERGTHHGPGEPGEGGECAEDGESLPAGTAAAGAGGQGCSGRGALQPPTTGRLGQVWAVLDRLVKFRVCIKVMVHTGEINICWTVLLERREEQNRRMKLDDKLQSRLFSAYHPSSEVQARLDELTHIKARLEEENQELRGKVMGLQADLDISEGVQRDFVKLSQTLQVPLYHILVLSILFRYLQPHISYTCG